MSDFKMFEKAPYELPDPIAFTEVGLAAIKEEEKTYGAVFTNRFIQYALEFLHQKIGEEPPKHIETMDQLKEHLISMSDKSPPWNTILYAQIKAENFFQTTTGAGTRVGAIGLTKQVPKRVSEERKIDLDDIVSQYRQAVLVTKTAQLEFGYKKNDDESVDLLFPNCYLLGACQQASNDELLKRISGGTQCSCTAFACTLFKLVTGYEWDYELLEFGKPHCITRCYMF
ncbi:MAG: hypothetical protein ACETWM_07865 [Candidatus Lokiarchaeia archaeon]